ncbi:methyltransferase [Streptomyces sp. NBC_01619]|uniref:methyltransferase n=1 Tax=Streptomyces sp. NBC_01619 TaxID=2975901 RepID=UPI0022586B57|nr:methyltransferase [Streptomyces sp. NBC_01619]MCX4515903.1 methyltransferase [Streptomyces sp. NBC_01619]
MKLTKDQAQKHSRACELVALKRDLTEDEREFVLDHWQESATARNALDGAFFTPAGLAVDLSIHAYGDRIIDLCAGIGRLAWSCRARARRMNNEADRELVCVERNPAYVAVGRKVLPEARWVCADVFHLPSDLGFFDTAISNPPFGRTARTGNGPGYTGPRFEYHVVAVAATLARNGAFILPQQSAPFRYSNRVQFSEERDAECLRFERQTGVQLKANCGIDTSPYTGEWNGVAPLTEVVTADFAEIAPRRSASTSAPLPAPRPKPASPASPRDADTLF